jgi:hypothetical protein
MYTDTAMRHIKKGGAETKQSTLLRTVRISQPHSSINSCSLLSKTALALAMSRDGSSGGVIRMCVITEDSVERLFVPGNELPKFWEGHEVLGALLAKQKIAVEMRVAPMAVEA